MLFGRAVSCYMWTMRVHRAPSPLGGPLKLQVQSQYLRSDLTEKVWKVPSTWPIYWSDLLCSLSIGKICCLGPCCNDDQYY